MIDGGIHVVYFGIDNVLKLRRMDTGEIVWQPEIWTARRSRLHGSRGPEIPFLHSIMSRTSSMNSSGRYNGRMAT